MRFSDKLVLVAGGTGGLGRAVNLSFLEEGAKVVVTYWVQTEFDALKSEAEAKSASIEGHRVDVTDETAVRQLLDRIVAEHGRLDVLVNTVGGYAGGVNLCNSRRRSSTRCSR
jgi:NAD(P)-dependent dehydrogenase (short-subunit alcohol dehydrogenase family)